MANRLNTNKALETYIDIIDLVLVYIIYDTNGIKPYMNINIHITNFAIKNPISVSAENNAITEKPTINKE